MGAASLIFLLSVIGFLEASRCPPEEDMAPCECESDGSFTIVNCYKVLNSEELIPPMRALAISGTEVNMLAIDTSSLLYLPENLFKNISIRSVILADSEIISLSDTDTAFIGLEDKLIMLLAKDITPASEWDFDQLRNLTELNYIILQDVPLGEISYPFPHLPRLSMLKIDNAGLSYVADDAFSKLTKLEIISMRDNDITEMRRTMLPNPANNLVIINLSQNKLTYLPRDFFDNMPSLSKVYLDKNKFTTLSEVPFSTAFRQLESLGMSENPFRCDCRMRWLVTMPFPSDFKGECSSPVVLFGRSINELDFKSLWC